MDHSEIQTKLESRDFGVLIGLVEDEYLEVKSAKYDTSILQLA